MWDKPAVMNLLANMLFAFSALLFFYIAFYVVVRLPIFPLREIAISGSLGHVTREQVQFIAKQQLRGNFFTLDLTRTQSAFQKLPWVRTVAVRRQWPDRLDVVIEEHQPLARWNNRALVNTRGEIFEAASSADLPIFNGEDGSAREMSEHYAAFSKMLATVGLRPRTVTLSARRAWQIGLESKTVLELGRREVLPRLAKFVRVYPQTLGRLAFPVEYVDLRYPNGFAVRAPAALLRKQPIDGEPA